MKDAEKAPGAPGLEPRWTSSSKSGIGKAINPASEVTFTLRDGILNEIFNHKIIVMKKLISFSILSILFIIILGIQPVMAQHNLGTEMTYKVDFGPVYPIEGRSIQLEGELGLNDTTGTVEKLNFEVSLTSFQGTNAGYLGWVANSWNNPDMSFKSNSIIKKDDHWVAKGMLEFRRRNNPVEIEFYRKNVGTEISVEGHFQLRPRDYFISSPPLDLVPTTIPVKFTMLFDQPSELKGGDESMTSETQKEE